MSIKLVKQNNFDQAIAQLDNKFGGWKVYSTYIDVNANFTRQNTAEEVARAMAPKSILIAYCGAEKGNLFPDTYSILTIKKITNDDISIESECLAGKNKYAYIRGSNSSGWWGSPTDTELNALVEKTIISVMGNSGYTSTSKLIKYGFGLCIICLDISKTDGTSLGNNDNVISIPVGYRPLETVTTSLRSTNGNASRSYPAFSILELNGNISIRVTENDTDAKIIRGTIVYRI